MTPDTLMALIRSEAEACFAQGQMRYMVALAGPPASGKSSLAANLVQTLGSGTKAVPMDGFHYDDAVLIARGLRQRKGAPETFDARGFQHLLQRLRSEAEVAIPLFDRDLEISRAGADVVMPDDRILIIEGNYLLLDQEPWRALGPLFDLTVTVEVPEEVLRSRLLERWRAHGKDQAAALHWIDSNDLPNIRAVVQNSRPGRLVIRNL